jgi:hypothetical protein
MPGIESRLWDRVDKSGECWVWMGHKVGGYGKIEWQGKSRGVHRVAYSLFHQISLEDVPPILDHKCENRACVNPLHLRPSTSRDNTLRSKIAPAAIHARQTHCIRGHEFARENTRVEKRGGRTCRICDSAQHRAKYLEKTELVGPWWRTYSGPIKRYAIKGNL